MDTNVDKLKSSYGGTKIKEEIGSLNNSHLVAPIFLHWNVPREGIVSPRFKVNAEGRERGDRNLTKN